MTAVDHRGRVARRGHRAGGQDTRGLRPRLVLGHARRGRVGGRAAHAPRHRRPRREVRLRGTRLRRVRRTCRRRKRADSTVRRSSGIAAAADAVADAGDLGADPARCGVVMGGGVGGLTTLEEQVIIRFEKGSTRVSPFLVPMMMVNATAGQHRDAVRLDRAEPLRRHRLRGERERDRRGRPDDPLRRGRRHARRWRRVLDHADRDGRVRAHDRAQHAQRRPRRTRRGRSTPTATAS